LLLALVIVTGCSNRAVFETLHSGNRYQCSKLPPSQYDDCIERINKSFKEYELERREALKKKL